MSERAIQNTILLAASKAGLTLWRNNVGMGWTGNAVRFADGSVRIAEPRPLHAGLHKGSSDLIGFRQVVVTAAHVGQTLAQFAAVEVKQPGRYPTADQRRFLEFVENAGGFALVARAAEDLG